jgi:hypothetical protein
VGGLSIYERLGSDHVTYGPMRGLKKVDMKRGQTDRKIYGYKDI